MSGDVGGLSSARTSVARAKGLVQDPQALDFRSGKHFLQLAGGTNDRTVGVLRDCETCRHRVSGIAYGGYARKALQPILEDLASRGAVRHEIEREPALLEEALRVATAVVSPFAAGPGGGA